MIKYIIKPFQLYGRFDVTAHVYSSTDCLFLDITGPKTHQAVLLNKLITAHQCSMIIFLHSLFYFRTNDILIFILFSLFILNKLFVPLLTLGSKFNKFECKLNWNICRVISYIVAMLKRFFSVQVGFFYPLQGPTDVLAVIVTAKLNQQYIWIPVQQYHKLQFLR